LLRRPSPIFILLHCRSWALGASVQTACAQIRCAAVIACQSPVWWYVVPARNAAAVASYRARAALRGRHTATGVRDRDRTPGSLPQGAHTTRRRKHTQHVVDVVTPAEHTAFIGVEPPTTAPVMAVSTGSAHSAVYVVHGEGLGQALTPPKGLTT
jgi:hypothetical protein